jgi:cell division septation protein DedD
MSNQEKSYLEIKVTLLHIVVLLAGVIVIGIFLFYLGYQAGKSSVQKPVLNAHVTGNGEKSREIDIIDNVDKDAAETVQKQEEAPSIDSEMNLNRQPGEEKDSENKAAKKEENKEENKETVIKPKAVARDAYYSIQVGAFSDFTNAKNYSEKFRKMGYPTEILSTMGEKGILYRVRVGNFPSRDKAQQDKDVLEKLENKKFEVVKSG